MTAMADGDDRLGLLDDTYTRHRAAALALAHRILGDVHLAEDAVQLAFVQILVRVRSGDVALVSANPRAVVLRGTRWAALKLAERDRDRHAAAPLEDASGGGVDTWERVEARLVSRDIVAALPPRYRDPLVLRYLEDQPDEGGAARLALTVKAYRGRLDRALAMARVVATRAGSAGAVVALVPRCGRRLRSWWVRGDARLRQERARFAETVGSPGFTHWAVVVAAIAAGSSSVLWGPAAGRAANARGAATALAGSPLTAAATPSAWATATPGMPASSTAHVAAPGSPEPTHAPAPSPLLPVFQPPPPQDNVIGQVIPAPRYDANHVVVMVGAGYNCRCTPLYRSLDGGATWETVNVGIQDGYVKLPPDYPDDPRILIQEESIPGAPACMLADFHSNTCMPLPIYGQVTFDSHFDSGSPLIFGSDAADQVLLVYDVDSLLVHPIVLSEQTWVRNILGPAPASSVDAYVIAQTTDDGVDSQGNVHSGQLVFKTLACHADLTCTLVSTNTFGWAQDVTIDPEDATGRTFFGQIPPPSNLQGWRSGWTADATATFPVTFTWGTTPGMGPGFQVTGPTNDLALYEETFDESGATPFEQLWRWSIDGHRVGLTLPIATSTSNYLLIYPINRDRLIAASPTGAQLGFWCSADGGVSWARECPPAH